MYTLNICENDNGGYRFCLNTEDGIVEVSSFDQAAKIVYRKCGLLENLTLTEFYYWRFMLGEYEGKRIDEFVSRKDLKIPD